ncbi:MAG: sulfite oxidase [Chthoniobacterales bacterium]|nr:sulfite oxidase [Chthoniobacterales bacterium]
MGESADGIDGKGRSEIGLINRGEEPLNLEMPFSALATWITPNEQFYVRCHFPVPQIDSATWRLQVEGAVAQPLELRLADLDQMQAHTIAATMECAGNGRSFLEPKVKGVAWDIGAVGNARWTGVLLRDVLALAGADRALEVILEGADRGTLKEAPKPPGEIQYARSLPFAKANTDVLLAYAMNGERLTPEHGYPLRAVVPGWFGMASVKWLQRIVVSEAPFNGYYQSIDYTYWTRDHELPTLAPLAEMRVKAQIARPEMHEVVPPGREYRVHGAAWSSDSDVVAVEVSTDGGRNWSPANLIGEPVKNAWRFWELRWQTPQHPTRCTLIARATDAAGRTQPRERIADYGTYMINHWLPISVEVR